MQHNIDHASDTARPSPGGGPQDYETAFAGAIAPDARAFSFWKGRVALYAILRALGIGPGDEVILPGFTCVVVPNAIRFAGAVPVYVDIASCEYNLDPARVQAAITPRTRAILVQHTFGIPGPIYECLDLARRHGLDVIEDSAHAFGSRLDGRPLGSFGRAAFFSTQWSKPYTTGLGGMAVTRDPELAAALRKVLDGFIPPPFAARFRLQFQYGIYQKFYSPRIYWQAQSMLQNFGRFGLFVSSSSDSELAGEMPADHAWRMPRAQQKAGLDKLTRFARALEHRRQLTAQYDQALQACGWPIPARPQGASILRYPVLVENKAELLEKARRGQVELGSWFETPLHPTPLSQHPRFGFDFHHNPNAAQMAARVVNLPMHEWVTPAEAERIVEFFQKNAVRVQPG
jgi:dTDP-4-amino-4,6-dideoxygalactose transaminase